MRPKIFGLWLVQAWSTYSYAEKRQHHLICITRAIDVTGRLKYITWITFRFLDNLTSINYGDKFEKFFCKIGLPELELEKEDETSPEGFFYILESLSNPMIFISNYLMNPIAWILGKKITHHL